MKIWPSTLEETSIAPGLALPRADILDVVGVISVSPSGQSWGPDRAGLCQKKNRACNAILPNALSSVSMAQDRQQGWLFRLDNDCSVGVSEPRTTQLLQQMLSAEWADCWLLPLGALTLFQHLSTDKRSVLDLRNRSLCRNFMLFWLIKRSNNGLSNLAKDRVVPLRYFAASHSPH